MVFSSLTFLFCFLPLVILVYYLWNNRTYRNLVLLIFSLGFYAWGEPVYIFLMLLSLLINYFSALLIDRYAQDNKKYAKFYFILNIIFNVMMLLVFKYADFMIKNVNFLFHLNLPLLRIALPIGISFYTFQIFSYVIDVYQGSVKVQKSFIMLSAYITLFPQLIAGPIVRYQTVENELKHRKENILDFSNGIRRFILGLGKKVLIANQVGFIADTIFSFNNGSLQTSAAWLGIVAYSLQIYFDFSGYSDMAIGLGQMFGFHFLENFNYPYIAQSITDFWRRWHISLSSWFKDYVYIPLGGNRVKLGRWFINIFIVWFLTGMWHGATWNFILWGLYFGSILVLEKLFLLKLLNKLPRLFRHLYALVLILFGWVIFRANDISEILNYFKSLFNVHGNNSLKFFYNVEIAHLTPYVLIGMLGCLPIFNKLFKRLNRTLIGGLIFDLFLMIIFILCIIFLINNSFNPFIYFRF